MIRSIWIALLLTASLFAAEIHWKKDYAQSVTEAEKANKPIVMVLTSPYCKWCRHLDNTTFKDSNVINGLNGDFISLYIDVNVNSNYPREFYTQSTPTIWFLDSHGIPMFQPVRGAIDAESFLEAMGIVKKEFAKTALKKR
jgi:thioredoxin-related protein